MPHRQIPNPIRHTVLQIWQVSGLQSPVTSILLSQSRVPYFNGKEMLRPATFPWTSCPASRTLPVLKSLAFTLATLLVTSAFFCVPYPTTTTSFRSVRSSSSEKLWWVEVALFSCLYGFCPRHPSSSRDTLFGLILGLLLSIILVCYSIALRSLPTAALIISLVPLPSET